MIPGVLAAIVILACGSTAKPVDPPSEPAKPATLADRILAMLPDGAQVVFELDLARLRDNPVVGGVVQRALAAIVVRGDAISTVPASPLADARMVVIAAYGVGTAQAGTLTILATTAEVPGGRRIAPDLVAVGPPDWLDQLAARAAIAGAHPITASDELLKLRDHAMPQGATGAALRITARLSFDARVALARQTGIEVAPQQVSVWGDVVDDLAIIVDTDAADPGDKTKQATKHLAHDVRAALNTLAETDVARALGIPASLGDAHQVQQGTWVRTIFAIGPQHLQRVVKRAGELLPAAAAPPAP